MSKKNGGNGGLIINIASLAGFIDFYPLPVYSATKRAIVQLVRCFGQPYHYKDSDVTIMALCPGYTLTTRLFDDISNENIKALNAFTETEAKQLYV